MSITSVLRDYLFWHYSAAYADIFGIIRNYLWVVNRKFSVFDVLRNLFAPFKRLKEEKVNIVHSPSDFFAALVVNIIMRIVGCIVRTALLAVALLAFLIVITLGILGILFWTALPALVAYFFISGLRYFF
ncbi:MAG: hypothetical protein AAB869_00030 [Patescibacteria group bacterium]